MVNGYIVSSIYPRARHGSSGVWEEEEVMGFLNQMRARYSTTTEDPEVTAPVVAKAGFPIVTVAILGAIGIGAFLYLKK